jgi:KDO2-lipid IV(A) lauroyltransferase
MISASRPRTRCGIDTVEIGRIERLLRDTPRDDLLRVFSEEELRDCGEGADHVARLAARFAAKEACLKLFPRETALGALDPADFAVTRDGYGAPRVRCSPRASELLGQHRLTAIALSLTHTEHSASAVAVAEPLHTEAPLSGRIIYRVFPFRRRIILNNLRQVFGHSVPEAEITRMAQAHYAHLFRSLVELARFPFLPPKRRAALARVENVEAVWAAHAEGKGVLILTGHFGNFELATVAGIGGNQQYRGRLHFVRRPVKPRWLETLLTRRFRRAGFGVLPRRGSLDEILERLAAGDGVVFILDQHAGGRDGVVVDFLGVPAATFRSLALIALSTGAPVVPAASWREDDGRHVLRFEEPLAVIEAEDLDEAVRLNTRAYNAALERLVLRHPEQWYWVHRRWKVSQTARGRVR